MPFGRYFHYKITNLQQTVQEKTSSITKSCSNHLSRLHCDSPFKDHLQRFSISYEESAFFFIISGVQLVKKWRGRPPLRKNNTFLKFVGFALILWKTFPMGYFAVDFGRKFFTSKNPSCAPAYNSNSHIHLVVLSPHVTHSKHCTITVII